MSSLLTWLLRILIVLYLLALALFLIGNFGLFGSEQGPLAGVFLVPLGLPWTWLVDAFPEPLWPWLAAAAPLVNIAILFVLSRAVSRR
jgi:drug/metabolite transporter superfamily protein YnfA